MSLRIGTYTASFKNALELSDNIGLLLGTIKVFDIVESYDGGEYLGDKVDFYITKISGKTRISPFQQGGIYILTADRLIYESEPKT